MSRLYATAITLHCPGCGLTRESGRAPWDPPAAARYDLYCGRCATGGKTGGIGTYRDEGGREIFEGGGRGEMSGTRRYTAEEVGAWSDAAVLHEAVGIVRGMAPDERRALVAGLLHGDNRTAAAAAAKPAPCGCPDCAHHRRNDEWIAGMAAWMTRRPKAG